MRERFYCIYVVTRNSIRDKMQSNLFVVTSVKQATAFKCQYSVIPNVHFNSNLTCVRQPSVSKGQYFAIPNEIF